ncbi:hypothetical protein Pla123a_46950 [Posidoniimonas polymericola]|uniref:Prepilin-type N-terminal cleavage/methylation domain-containing protein n=1 Tax=Posidoniimonas polymericola TaxID=2528002 RepID=A0A5C5XUQ7_9BACT|nr:type II secretion system protein [Posidoniimonas polymericola]TWT66301.1 hypothetical protein Pla123a_46950 [Posidoniimonas polymericola]
MPPDSTPPKPRRRSGYSLLELVLAIALAGGTLAPALALLRDGMTVSRETDQQLLLTNYAIQILEERMAAASASWDDTAASGSFAADGFASIRYTATASDSATDGGEPNALMHIHVTTYVDENANTTYDTGEPSCSFRTKVASLQSYVDKATN